MYLHNKMQLRGTYLEQFSEKESANKITIDAIALNNKNPSYFL